MKSWSRRRAKVPIPGTEPRLGHQTTAAHHRAAFLLCAGQLLSPLGPAQTQIWGLESNQIPCAGKLSKLPLRLLTTFIYGLNK